MSVWTGLIAKAPDFALCKDEATNSVGITEPAFRDDFADAGHTIRPRRFLDVIVAHGDECDLIG